MFLGRLFGRPKTDVVEQKRIAIYRNLLKREAAIGGEIFGPIPKGGRREFFCLDESTWVWHEEWTDDNGQRQIRNTRYDVRPSGILKAQNGQAYSKLSPQEAKNLEAAIHTYVQRVKKDIYATS
jgi:hypothetical protein